MEALRNSMLKRFFHFLFGLLPFGASAQKDLNPINILFIGNSFTHMNSMPVMFEKLATSKSYRVNVVMSAKSNHTFQMHSEREDLYQDINKYKYDYVILQGFSRELSFGYEHIDTAVVPYFKQIVDTLYQNNPCVKLLLYMTWGYENGYAYSDYLGSYDQMSLEIEKGYRYLGDLFEIPVIPVGNVWKEVRKNYPTIKLYQSDEHHPTKYGSYIVASSVYTAIFRTTPVGGFTSNIPEEIAYPIQTTAYSYVMKNLKEFNLDQNILDVNHEFTKDGKFKVNVKANYPNADSLQWDFGDGVTSEKNNDHHYFKTFGTYYVKLTVHDRCGTRIIYRPITFKEPYKPKPVPVSKPITEYKPKYKRI